jgi:hypothetical protein
MRNRTTLFLVVVGLVALPGLAVAGTGDSAAEPAPEAVGPNLAGAADAWFADLLFGMVPDWVQDWLDSERDAAGGPHERPQQEDVPQRGAGEEPSFGGVDDPAGPWA